MATPNVALSVIDYFNSRGLDSSQTNRKKVYYNLGLDKTLGEWTGSAIQNPATIQALTKRERDLGVTINPNNFNDVLNIGSAPVAPTPPVQTPASNVITTGPWAGYIPTDQGYQLAPKVTPGATTAIEAASAAPPQPTATSVLEAAQKGVNIQDYLSSLPGAKPVPTGQGLIKQATEEVMSGADMPIRQAQAEAEKAALKLKAQKETETYINDMAKKGMTFSGARTAGVSSIEVDTLAKQLNVDRSVALLVATGMENAAQRIVKEAQNENSQVRTEAIKALSDMGYVIDPISGQLVQKPSEARAAEDQRFQQEAQVRAAEDQAMQREQLAMQYARLNQSEENQARLEQAFNLSVLKYENEQDRKVAITQGNFNDYINGTIGLGDLESAERPQVTEAARSWLQNEQNSVGMIARKLEIGSDLKQAVTLTDSEIRNLVYDDVVQGKSKEQILSNLPKSGVANVDRAKQITEEIYNPKVINFNSGFVPASGSSLNIGVNPSSGNMMNLSFPTQSLFRF